MLTVQKFGGSSVADAEGVSRSAALIAAAGSGGNKVVAVLSAAGDTSDILTRAAEDITPAPSKRELDALLSTGELSSVALMAIKLHSMGFDCVSLSGRQAGILTDAAHGDARIINIDCRRIRSELETGRIVIVAGFQGINGSDDVTTLGRGGSDYTAAALAAALGADKCEIFTDVDGIYTADPRLVPEARKLSAIDFEDMLLLSEHGSQVLQRRCVEAAMRSGTELVLRSSFVNAPGTRVTELIPRPDLAGVTRDTAKSTVSLVGCAANASVLDAMCRMLAVRGIGIRSALTERGVCTVTVPPDELSVALNTVHEMIV